MLDGLLPSPALKNSLEKAAAKYEAEVDSLRSFLEPRGIGRDAAVQARLGRVSVPEPGHERMEGWMSIPYVSPGGVLALKFRCVADHPCKEVGCQRYDAPAGQKTRLYGVHSLHNPNADTVLVCEGEMDTLVAQSALGVPAVGTSAGQWLPHWPRCLADYDRVVIVADNDDAGVKHAKKVQSTVPESRIVLPPEGFDLGEWIQRDGVDEVVKGIGL